jgi:predicted solute-binding protein
MKNLFQNRNVNQSRERADEILNSAHLTVELETTSVSMFVFVQIKDRYK